MNHGNQTQTGRFIFDRKNVVVAFAECGGGLEDNLPALRLDAQGVRFQGLEIRAADEVGVAYPDFRIERIFILRHETVRRKHVQPRGDFLSQIRMSRIGQAVQRSLEHPPGIGQCADNLPGIFHKVAVDRGRTPAAVFEVINFYGGGVHPIPAVQFFPGIFLEEHDVRGHIGQRVLAKGRFRKADSAQEVGVLRDMLTRRGIDGIHEITADHKGRDAAFPQQIDGLGEEVVVDRELSQLRKVRVIQRLIAEGRIADYGIYTAGTELTVLETNIEMFCFGIEVLRDGRGCGVKFHSHETGIEIFGTEADEIADARRRFKNTERFSSTKAEAGQPLIDTSDDSFRGIMGVLGGTAGGSVGFRGKQILHFPVFGGPLFVFGVKDLRQPAPAHITDEDFLFLRRGQYRAVGLKPFEQAYGGDVIRIFGFRAANAQSVFCGYPVIFRLMSMPMLSNISESDIPRRLASRAVSLLRALASVCCCPYSFRSKSKFPIASSFFSSSGLFSAQRSRIE